MLVGMAVTYLLTCVLVMMVVMMAVTKISQTLAREREVMDDVLRQENQLEEVSK